MRRATKLLHLVFAVAMVVSFVGNGPWTQEAAGATKVTLVLPSKIIPQFGFYLVGKELFAKQEDLDLEIVGSQGAPDALKHAVAGTADFSYTGTSAQILAKAKDVPSVMVYATSQSFTYGIVALADKGINSVSDLRGKTIGVVGFSSGTYYSIIASLKAAGLKKEDVKFVTLGQEGPSALMSGRVDAIGSWIYQWIPLEAKGVKLKVIETSEYNSRESGGVVVSETLVKSKPDLIKRFLRVVHKSIEYTQNNPEKALDIVAKYIPEQTKDRETALKQMMISVGTAFTGPAKKYGIGYIDGESRQMQADFFYELGVIEKKVDMSDSFTSAFLDDARK